MYLSINGTDLSPYVTENSFCCTIEPVYDTSAEYVNANGVKVRTWCGTRTAVRAELTDMTEAAVRSLRSAASAETAEAVIFAPDRQELTVNISHLEVRLSRRENGSSYYTGEIACSTPDRGYL